MVMMVIVLENADDQGNQLNDYAAEQQENFPSHVHYTSPPSMDIEKGKRNVSFPMSGLRKQPPPFGCSFEQSVARIYHNTKGEICQYQAGIKKTAKGLDKFHLLLYNTNREATDGRLLPLKEF